MLYVHFPEWITPYVISGLPFRWYGMMYLANFIISYYLIRYQANQLDPPLDQDTLFKMTFAIIIGILVGARLFSTLLYDTSGYYLKKPWLIFWPFSADMKFMGLQGMSYHGGLVGGVVGFLISYIKNIKKHYNILELIDIVIAAIPIGYTLGRIGNFINGELYGRITLSPIGMVFPLAEKLPISNPIVLEHASKLSIYPDESGMVNLPRHPSQLYEAFFEGLVLWTLLWFVVRKRKPYTGFVLCSYLVGYGMIRFIIEYFRQPDLELGFIVSFVKNNPLWLLLTPWNFTMGQILSLLMIITGVTLAVIFYHKQKIIPSIQTFDDTKKEKPNFRKQKKRFHLR